MNANQIVPPKTSQVFIVRAISNDLFLFLFFCCYVLFIFLNDYSFTSFPYFNCNCFIKPNPLEDL